MPIVLLALAALQSQTVPLPQLAEKPRPALEKSADEVARDTAYFTALGLEDSGISKGAATCGGALTRELLAFVVPRRIVDVESPAALAAANDYFWRGHLQLADELGASGCPEQARALYEKSLKFSAGANQLQFIEWAKYGLSKLPAK
jgi:hypothetical protein